MAVGAFAGARLELVVGDARLLLHRGGGVAADLHPEPVDLAPGMGGEDPRQHGPRHGLAPHADPFGDDVDARIFREHRLRGFGALGIDRGAGHAGDDDDVALAVQRLDQPFGGNAAGVELVDMDVVGARLGDLGIIGDDHDVPRAGASHHLVERGRRDRIDDDGLRALLHHRIDLLDLALRIGPRDLHLEAHLVAIVLRGGHGLHHVRRLRLPVIPDIAHGKEDLELLPGGLGMVGGGGEPEGDRHGEQGRFPSHDVSSSVPNLRGGEAAWSRLPLGDEIFLSTDI